LCWLLCCWYRPCVCSIGKSVLVMNETYYLEGHIYVCKREQFVAYHESHESWMDFSNDCIFLVARHACVFILQGKSPTTTNKNTVMDRQQFPSSSQSSQAANIPSNATWSKVVVVVPYNFTTSSIDNFGWLVRHHPTSRRNHPRTMADTHVRIGLVESVTDLMFR
jgi:hypothetical protein